MNVEIIDFYPLEQIEEKGFLSGTLRVKLPDIGIHILGIFVSKCKNRWHFVMPGRQGTYHQSGDKVRYPFIVFEEREQQKALIDAIREKAPSFIENRLTDTGNPLSFPPKKVTSRPLQVKQTTKEAKPEVKKPMSEQATPSDKPKATIAAKVWQDPPKRPPQQLIHKTFARR
jgi:hypothetical protein